MSNQTIRLKCVACGHETRIKSYHKLTAYIIKHISTSTQNTPPSSNNRIEDDDLCVVKDPTSSDQKGLRFDAGLMYKKEKYYIFYNLVKEAIDTNKICEPSVQKHIYEEAKRLNVQDKAVLVLCELLFTDNILDEICIHKMLFLRLCLCNKKAQKYLLGGYEILVGVVYKDTLFNKALKILKHLYDEEILDEDVIIEWSLKVSKKFVDREMSKKIHDKVTPLINWLKGIL